MTAAKKAQSMMYMFKDPHSNHHGAIICTGTRDVSLIDSLHIHVKGIQFAKALWDTLPTGPQQGDAKEAERKNSKNALERPLSFDEKQLHLCSRKLQESHLTRCISKACIRKTPHLKNPAHSPNLGQSPFYSCPSAFTPRISLGDLPF